MSKPLKLIAQTNDDLTILSALLQDMTIKVGDIAWRPNENKLICVGNRFVWEKKKLFRKPKGERTRTAFHIATAMKCRFKNLDLSDTERVLELLSIEASEKGDILEIILTFAGGAAIALHTEAIEIIATDVSEPWQAIARPRHD